MTHFPILWPSIRRDWQVYKDAGCPHSIPLAVIAPHEKQARRNHDQSLARLAERGGLSPAEAIAVLTDRNYWDMIRVEPALAKHETAIAELIRLVGGGRSQEEKE